MPCIDTHKFPMKKIILTVLAFYCVNTSFSQAHDTARYIKVPAGFLMVLRQGDDVFKHLEELAVRKISRRQALAEWVL